jgi:hypothetical protein
MLQIAQAPKHSGGFMSSKTITDHDEIQRWTEQRGGKPACVRGTGGKHDVGMLRLEFPDRAQSNDEGLRPISWEDWFAAFDANGLALIVQDETAQGKPSRFNKLVAREAENASGGKGSHRR